MPKRSQLTRKKMVFAGCNPNLSQFQHFSGKIILSKITQMVIFWSRDLKRVSKKLLWQYLSGKINKKKVYCHRFKSYKHFVRINGCKLTWLRESGRWYKQFVTKNKKKFTVLKKIIYTGLAIYGRNETDKINRSRQNTYWWSPCRK